MSASNLKDAVVVVTGGAQGIGKNIARAFAAAGARIVIDDIDSKSSRATKKEFLSSGWAVTMLKIDLRKGGAGRELIDAVAKKHGRIDVLINNARSRLRTTLQSETEASWHESMAVNLRAHFFAAQAALSFMAQQGAGAIVNIGSPAGTHSCHESPTYHIAKAGLIQMTRYLAAHCATGIRVNCVVPGLIVKDEHEQRYAKADNAGFRKTVEFAHPLGRPGSADDIAQAVRWLCSKEAKFITGQTLIVDGGLSIQEPYDLLASFDQMRQNKIDG
jgi:NAD(P)-dependent dehydrogenase (short-subunit alcohol dehydrogenase family)